MREAAKRDKKLKFTALLHDVSIDLLRESYHSLKKQAAPGVDGVTWQEYGNSLEERLADLQVQQLQQYAAVMTNRRMPCPNQNLPMRPFRSQSKLL
ncbi:MAG: hypothetical protein KIT09_12540 [Bryobacteraceae bacterium]|nr:hypothetical protein [Bryobacteraceae bacterium]